MTTHEVHILEPGVQFNDTMQTWEAYSANIYVKPPIQVGPELPAFLAGGPTDLTITEVASDDKGSHLIVRSKGRGADPDRVVNATRRLQEYLNTDPQGRGLLGSQYAIHPLSPDHSPQQM